MSASLASPRGTGESAAAGAQKPLPDTGGDGSSAAALWPLNPCTRIFLSRSGGRAQIETPLFVMASAGLPQVQPVY